MMQNNAGAADLWPAMDLLLFDSPNVNPLLANYAGVPGRVKGSDPTDYAHAARAYWMGGEQPPVQPAGILPKFDLGLREWLDAKADGLKLSAAGILLALLVVAVGLLILYKSA